MDRLPRLRLARQAVWVSEASVVWALAVGIAALAAGVVARSLGLVALGLDSIVDGSASILLVWRFRLEVLSPDRAAAAEHLANRLVGVALISAAIFVAVQAIVDLAGRSGPAPTSFGLGLAAASTVVLPLLARLKLQLARQLGSAALRADGFLSLAGACLATAALLGLVLAGAFGWWWTDSTAALVIATVLAWQGRQAVATAP